MGVYRLYKGDDDECHIEEIDLNQHPEMTQVQYAAGIRFRQRQPGPASPFEPEPARRWMVIISGKFEVGLGDGSKHQFGPGDIRLIEDTTGHGHTSQFLEPTTFAVVEIDPTLVPGR